MRTQAVALFALLLAALVAVAAAVDDPRTGGSGASFVKAPTCCAGCSYDNSNNCCCAKRNALPATSTKRIIKALGTKRLVSTATRTKTIVKRLKKRSDIGALELPIDSSLDAPIAHALESRQQGRNLCPVCPKGASLASGGNSGLPGCCPARRTIKKTVTVKRWMTKYTKTTTRLATVTAFRVSIKGKLLNMKKQGQRKILITLVSAAPKRRLMGRQKAKKEPEVVGMDLTAADGTFEIAGVAVPGTLQVVAGDKADKKTIGEITISKTGAVENQGNIGTIQEPRIAPFTPKAKCKVSPKSKPSGQILQKIKLTADLTDSEKDGSITSAIVTKRQGSGSDFFLGTESGYFGVSDGNSTISIKLQAAAGKKIVVTGFGLKSAALAPDSDSGFQFSLYTDLDPTPVATEPFKWAPGCPDDGQLHRIYEYTSEERAWGNATIELTAFALVGKVHLAQLEIYGRVEASSDVTTTAAEALPTTTAAEALPTTTVAAGTTTTPITTTSCTSTPWYDGKTLPWLAWRDETPGDNDGRIYDFDIDASGDIYFCGLTSFKVTFGSFTINGNYTYIGFVGKVSPNGTVHWVTSTIHDGANTMADAGIKGCKLSSDGSSLMVTGYSNEANVAFAGKTFAKSGESDNFVAILDPATGSASHLVGIGGAGLNNFFIDTIPIASKNGSLYAVLGAVNQSAFSDNSTNKLECTAERCCVVVKYTGSTRVWESLLHVASCGFGGIALSEDGSTVFAGGNTLLTALNAADGSEIAKKTVPMEIKDIATLGSTPYVLFRGRGTGTFDSVSIAGPADKTTAMVVKFTLSGSTISASAGTWVGTDEYDTTPYALVPGYDASGNANRLLVSLEISGSTLKSGTGYSKEYAAPFDFTANIYGVGILAFIDAANFNVSASVGIGGFNWIYPDTFNLLMQAKMTPAGDVFTAGQVQSLQDKSCMWDFGNDTWNGGPNGMMGQGFPLIAQFTSSLEYLSARV